MHCTQWILLAVPTGYVDRYIQIDCACLFMMFQGSHIRQRIHDSSEQFLSELD